MYVKQLYSTQDAKEYIDAIGVDSGGLSILNDKSRLYVFLIKALHVGAANILKQDALSIGADVAVPRGTIVAQEPYVDVLLFGTRKAIKILSKKELAQPFGLKELALALQRHLSVKKYPTRIMGIINANDDSFFEGSRFKGADAIAKIEQMIQEGATIIDIGAVSSRPGALSVSVDEELSRFTPIADMIAKHKLYEKVDFSIDSYSPAVIEYALQSGFSIVNDITGLQDDRVCELAASYGASVVIMHMQGTPQSMQDSPHYEDVIAEVEAFFVERIAKAQRFGIEDIILDVGIGFGKRLEHNIALIKHLGHFSALGYELLIGASRKSMIDKLSPCAPSKRLAGSVILHVKAVENGASIVRTHDVFEQMQALRVHEALT